MPLSTKCLHVSSSLCKAELVLCGGILNGREKEESCNFCQKYCQEVISSLKWNEREQGERGICHRISITLAKRSLTFGIEDPASNSGPRTDLQAKF